MLINNALVPRLLVVYKVNRICLLYLLGANDSRAKETEILNNEKPYYCVNISN